MFTVDRITIFLLVTVIIVGEHKEANEAKKPWDSRQSVLKFADADKAGGVCTMRAATAVMEICLYLYIYTCFYGIYEASLVLTLD